MKHVFLRQRLPLVPSCLLSLVIVTGSADVASAQRTDSPFIRRDQTKLNLSGAEMMIAASRMKAAEIGVNVNISVVDDGGHLMAFARMDDARPGSVYTSMTKATAAATKRGDTGPLPNADNPNTQLSIAVENAAATSGGKFTSLKGGIAIIVDGQVIGAVGVGGASGEQDAEVASAGVQALLNNLDTNQPGGNDSDLSGVPRTLFQNWPRTLFQNWLVEDIEGRGVVDRAQTTIQFDRDGRAYGSTGLNRFMTTPSLMDQEANFLAALQKVRKYEIDANGRLYLLDQDDRQVLWLTELKK